MHETYSKLSKERKFSNDVDVYLKGYRVISNQIEHLKEKLNNVSNLPNPYSINFLGFKL